MSGTLGMLPSEYAEVVERGKAWLTVYEPCGTPDCESPTCGLAYAIRRAVAVDESQAGLGPEDACVCGHPLGACSRCRGAEEWS